MLLIELAWMGPGGCRDRRYDITIRARAQMRSSLRRQDLDLPPADPRWAARGDHAQVAHVSEGLGRRELQRLLVAGEAVEGVQQLQRAARRAAPQLVRG